MKKHYSGIAALLVAITLSAFSLQPVKATGQSYTWVKTLPDGTPVPTDIFTGAVPLARVHFQCPNDGLNFCAAECNSVGQTIIGGLKIRRN